MSKIKHFIIVSFIAFPCLATTIYAQKVWEKKPYQQWSLSEVVQILSDSPWAQTQVKEEHDSFGTYLITIRLRSALVVRQALVRQKQIHLNYDKFRPADKARFDAEVKEFLECPDCEKYYIITIGSMNDLYPIRAIKESSLDKLRPYVFLTNDKGERRDLVHFIPPKNKQGEAMFVFSRFDDQGKPLLTVDNKTFHFKIDEKVFEGQTPPLKKFTFEVSKLLQRGDIVF
ncbi:MAG TPA: hypothetical protein VF528_09175 [Pyrinomonadaceae bacterium]|jgi:hypothetical protein